MEAHWRSTRFLKNVERGQCESMMNCLCTSSKPFTSVQEGIRMHQASEKLCAKLLIGDTASSGGSAHTQKAKPGPDPTVECPNASIYIIKSMCFKMLSLIYFALILCICSIIVFALLFSSHGCRRIERYAAFQALTSRCSASTTQKQKLRFEEVDSKEKEHEKKHFFVLREGSVTVSYCPLTNVQGQKSCRGRCRR